MTNNLIRTIIGFQIGRIRKAFINVRTIDDSLFNVNAFQFFALYSLLKADRNFYAALPSTVLSKFNVFFLLSGFFISPFRIFLNIKTFRFSIRKYVSRSFSYNCCSFFLCFFHFGCWTWRSASLFLWLLNSFHAIAQVMFHPKHS